MRTSINVDTSRAQSDIPQTKVGMGEVKTVNLDDIWQSTYLCISLGCTYEELKHAAGQVGNSEVRLRRYFEDKLPPIL